jgi:hypothetical protein
VTVGTPDANGAGAKSVGFLDIKVPSPSNGRVTITARISDVRCLPGTSAGVCSSANAEDGPDYSGRLQMNTTIRMTDHYNGPGLNEPATVVDIPFPATLQCSATADTSIGGVCTIPENVTRPALVPDGAQSRVVVDVAQIQIFDGGADGQVATADNTRFEVQGLFIQ